MASSVRVKFTANRAGINQATQIEGVRRDLDRRADRVLLEVERTAPRDTGAYARDVKRERFTRRGKAGARITAHDHKSAWIEFGTGPHVIEAKNGKALSWPGAKHPVKKVHHPGTPAFHTLRNALRAAGRL